MDTSLSLQPVRRGKKRSSEVPCKLPKPKKPKPPLNKPPKPVDDIRFVKSTLRNILDRRSPLWPKIERFVPIISELTTNAYLLLNLHIRRLVEQDLPLPKITANFLRMFFYTFYKSAGTISPDIQFTYDKYMSSLLKKDFTVPVGLIDGACTQMVTAIHNNIHIHFFKRQFKYLRLNNPGMSPAQIRDLQDQINKSPVNHLTLPDARDADTSIPLLLKKNPDSFLKPMYHMLKYIKEEQARCQVDPTLPNAKYITGATFALLPMRRSFVPGSIAIDSSTLASLIPSDPASKRFRDAKVKKEPKAADPPESKGSQSQSTPKKKKGSSKTNQLPRYNDLWEAHFKLGKFLKRHKRPFDYRILTDGVSACLQVKGHQKVIPEPDEDESPDILIPKFKSEELKDKTVVGIDPGMISLLYMTSDDASPKHCKSTPVRLEYRKAQREHDLHTKEFKTKRDKLQSAAKKSGVDVVALETQLSLTDGRAANLDEYHKYVLAHQAVSGELYAHYSNPRYREFLFISYRGKQKSESKLVNGMKSKWGSDAVFAFGNWKRSTQMKGVSSVPLTRMRKVVKKAFPYVVDVPEYKTTVTCSKCRTGLMGEAFEDRKIRGLRRCNNEECGVLMARDYNAAMNIKRNLEHWILHGIWDPAFTRGTHVAPEASPETVITGDTNCSVGSTGSGTSVVQLVN